MLTPRQTEVARLVARRMSSKAIARELGISVQTVHDHIFDAASRIPGDGRPREKVMCWFFEWSADEEAA